MEIQRIRREKELTIHKVPLEPEPTNSNACHLQIKLGERTMKRRFLMSDTLEVYYSYPAFIKPQPCNELFLSLLLGCISLDI